MLNPFIPFPHKMIAALRKIGHRYLVSQTNTQAMDHFSDDDKDPILFSDYADLSSAQIHFNALTDKYKAILDLENVKHRTKVEEMIGLNSKYRVYVAFIDDMKKIEKQLNTKYSAAVRNYITRKTASRVSAGEVIQPKLELIFGELFITLRYRSQVERFRLSDLEKY